MPPALIKLEGYKYPPQDSTYILHFCLPDPGESLPFLAAAESDFPGVTDFTLVSFFVLPEADLVRVVLAVFAEEFLALEA